MISKQFFNSLFPAAGLSARKYNLVRERDALIAALNKFLPQYGITTHRRLCAFLANCGVETDYFKTTIEYASGWNYDISVNPALARRLGNLRRGDGPKYKGSGLSQTTGRDNFADVQEIVGARLGVNVVENPQILRENIAVAVESALIFWQLNDLNAYADRGEFKQLSALVNRGDARKTPLHWEKRRELYARLKRLIPEDFSLAQLAPETGGENFAASFAAEQSPEGSAVPEITSGGGESANALKELGTTVFLHTPKDTVKNICVVIGARVLAGLVTIWSLGLHGQIFLIAAAAIFLAAFAYALYRYADRAISGAKQAIEYFFK